MRIRLAQATRHSGCTADPDKMAAEQAAAQKRLEEMAAAEKAAAEEAARQQAEKEAAEKAAEEAENANKPIGAHVCECGWSVEVYPGHEVEAEDALCAHLDSGNCSGWTSVIY